MSARRGIERSILCAGILNWPFDRTAAHQRPLAALGLTTLLNMATYLLVIGDREALGWILAEQRMAFSSMSRPHVRALSPGDTLLLYTTRGCFKNPTRDRGAHRRCHRQGVRPGP